MSSSSDRKALIFARLFPPRNRAGDQTKLRILESAIEFMVTEGLENMTFAAVGQPLKMNAAQVKYHFPDKSDLVDRALDYVNLLGQEMMLAHLETATDWRGRIHALVNGFFDWAETYPGHARMLLLLYYSASFSEKYRKLHTRLFETGLARVTAILDEARRPKRWSAAKARSIGLTVWAILDGMMVYHLSTEKRDDPQYFRREALKAVRAVIG